MGAKRGERRRQPAYIGRACRVVVRSPTAFKCLLPPRPLLPCTADRIAATLQLLTFFFISVFAFDPKKFCEDAIGPDPNNPTGPAPYACPINKNSDDPEEDYPNFFQLPVLMLMLITLLNDGTLISVGYDRVKPSPRPGERRPARPGTLADPAPHGPAGSLQGPALAACLPPCPPRLLPPALRLPGSQRSGTCGCCSWCPPCWASFPWAPPCCWSAWSWTPPTRAPSSRSGACLCR